VSASPLKRELLEDGAIWRLILDAPKGNILDASMVEALTASYQEAQETPGLKGIVIEGSGRHFSFGASVPEHMPGQVDGMLQRFHGLFKTMLESAVFSIAAVRGQCLGGGLELASFCNRVICAPGSKLGQPEIVLGVFAPVASVILSERVGRGAAEDICLSGRSVGAVEALAMGLADELAEDPGEAAVAWLRSNLLPKSASSLRLALQAVRLGYARRFKAEIEAAEKLYLTKLMKTEDAIEGLEAFVEKRIPRWRNQ